MYVKASGGRPAASTPATTKEAPAQTVATAPTQASPARRRRRRRSGEVEVAGGGGGGGGEGEEVEAGASRSASFQSPERSGIFFETLSSFASLASSAVVLLRRVCRSLALFYSRRWRIESERKAPLSKRERVSFFAPLSFSKKNESHRPQFSRGGKEIGVDDSKRKEKNKKAMPPASLLGSASASAAVAAPPVRSSRLPRILSMPARTAVGVAASGSLQRRRQLPSSSSSSTTTAAKAMPTAIASPAAAEQRPIPGEDLFMVREDRIRSPPSVETFFGERWESKGDWKEAMKGLVLSRLAAAAPQRS